MYGAYTLESSTIISAFIRFLISLRFSLRPVKNNDDFLVIASVAEASQIVKQKHLTQIYILVVSTIL